MYTQVVIKKFLLFFCTVYRVNGKNINFNNETIKKVTSTTKTKKDLIEMILMLIKY